MRGRLQNTPNILLREFLRRQAVQQTVFTYRTKSVEIGRGYDRYTALVFSRQRHTTVQKVERHIFGRKTLDQIFFSENIHLAAVRYLTTLTSPF